jgi:GT2 family glycosyltransferase
MDLSIIIVNYNTEDHLKKCLNSIFESVYETEYEVIVVDNNSSNRVIKKFPGFFNNTRFIFNDVNYGFGGGCNIGFKESKGKYLAFVNPDTYFTGNCFDPLLDYMKPNINIGFCSGLLINEQDKLIYSFNDFPGIYWEFLEARGWGVPQKIRNLLNREEIIITKKPFDVDWFNGAFIVTSRELFKEINGFDDNNFFLYYEDVDIQLKSKNLGKRNVCIPSVKVKHYERSSVRSFEGENFYYFHMHRSKILYYYKNAIFIKRNLIRLMHIIGFLFRLLFLPFRRRFKLKKYQKLYQYVMLIKIYLSLKSQILKMNNIPKNFILRYIDKKGLNKFVVDEFWQKV